ncbi:hypothetical protein LPU83_1418 [Rhizobium favelukesii]|uniref:Uncharacterized protein n=1 Tax=Rhizobium favelukesii TaxID=348824 RepID=W6RRS2_9HYPH|nr:hypothetical protein LPU83_1418 [Rhizobium favelukesii]
MRRVLAELLAEGKGAAKPDGTIWRKVTSLPQPFIAWRVLKLIALYDCFGDKHRAMPARIEG